MKCQYCSCLDSKVIDSRPTDDGNSIRRRRECTNRDGRRESFDSQKIKAGILHACDKLPVSMQQIDEIVTRVEQKAYASMDGEIQSEKIGDMVMSELKELNDVAYVRFAAVYRKFTDVGTFMNELKKLVDEKM